jgi:CubicO group peptidase (beta-lactamase class C family)
MGGYFMQNNKTMKSFLSSLLIAMLIFAQTGFTARNSFAQNQIRQPVSGTDNLATRLAAIEKTINQRMSALGIPGLALAIVKDDKVIFMKGFGVKDFERKIPVTPYTLFAIGSSSKAFTSMATMMSADDGKLALDDSPKKYLPYFKLRDAEADAAVTLRDLLCHRTGLDRTDLSLQFPGMLTREDIIKIAGLAKPSAKLREKFQYQNTMFTAAGEAAAKANETTWEKLIEARIFKPLGMKATNTSIFEMQKSTDFSLGYDYNPETKETQNLKMVDLTPAAPAGAINSNARDMAQWLKLLLGGGVFEGQRLVSEKNFNELFTQQIQIAPKLGYGLGWFVRDWRGQKEIEHGGNIDGFSATVAMIPGERLGFVMLSNITISALQHEIREIVWSNMLGSPGKNTEAKIPEPAGNPQLEIGKYLLSQAGLTLEVSLKSGSLVLSAPGQPDSILENVGGRRYKIGAPAPDGYFVTFRPVQGNVNANEMYLEQPQGNVALAKVEASNNTNSAETFPLTVEELMKKVVEAAGGEVNLRKHASMVMETTTDLENEGMTGETVVSTKAPNLSAAAMKYFALGKELGTNFDYFDGRGGVSFIVSGKTMVGNPLMRRGKLLEDARIAADFYAPLGWKTLYKNVSIKKMSKIGDEDVYVVVKTPENAHPVTDYISAKSFLVLRRESSQPAGYGDATVPYFENFSDYRTIDGVNLPFKVISGSAAGTNMTTVKSVKFNVEVPDSAFRPPSTIFMNKDKPANGQTTQKQSPAANPSDVASIDAIIKALYAVISGDAGKKRDWDRLRSLFAEGGKMIPLAPKREGVGFEPRFLTVDGYIERSGNYVETNGFFERELSRKTEQFGNIAHVFSTYEGKHKQSDEIPFLRGINSIQLANDGTRWWILNIAWDSERPDNLLPEKYLPSKN